MNRKFLYIIYTLLFFYCTTIYSQDYDLENFILSKIQFQNQVINQKFNTEKNKLDFKKLITEYDSILNNNKFNVVDNCAYNTLLALHEYKQKGTYKAIALTVKNINKLKSSNYNGDLLLINEFSLAYYLLVIRAYDKSLLKINAIATNDDLENYLLNDEQYYIYTLKNNYKEAVNYLLKNLSFCASLSKYDYVNYLLNLSSVQEKLNNNALALKYALKADSVNINSTLPLINNKLYYKKEIYDLKKTSLILNIEVKKQLGISYRITKNYISAQNCFDKAIEQANTLNYTSILAGLYVDKAIAYTQNGNYIEANAYYDRALSIYAKEKNYVLTHEVENLQTKNFILNNDLIEAKKLNAKVIDECKALNDKKNAAVAYYLEYDIYLKYSDYVSSQKAYKNFIVLNEQLLNAKQKDDDELNAINLEATNFLNKVDSEIFEFDKLELQTKNTEYQAKQIENELQLVKAEREFNNQKLITEKLEKDQIQKSLELIRRQLAQEKLLKEVNEVKKQNELQVINNANNENKIKLLGVNKQLLEKKNELNVKELDAANSQRKIFSMFLFLALAFILSLVYFLRKNTAQKREIEKTGKSLVVANSSLSEKVEEITLQKNIIEEKNNQIFDSIMYAQQIQNAFLLNPNELNLYFSNAFVFNKPKDIVSGDFSCLFKLKNTLLLVVADCTGHGVPGAMISALAYQELNNIIKHNTFNSLKDVLINLNRTINELLNNQKNNEPGTDGLDILLLNINLQTKIITYNGAKNSFLIINSLNELTEYKSSRISIGTQNNFEEYLMDDISVQINDNDFLFAYTDGFQDQLNPNNKRYGNKSFKELLCQLAKQTGNYTFDLDRNLDEIKKNAKQTDDITIIGIKFA